MSASAIHHCQHCGYETEVMSSLSVFEEDPYCRQCGLSASESDTKMQDELASLMTQHLHLTNNTPHQSYHVATPPPSQELLPHPPITYITQHYHHSAHQGPNGGVDDFSASNILSAAGVDPSTLFPSQIGLFKNALPDQRLRLIELWRIAPPSYSMAAKNLGNWPPTSLEQEEEAAKARWGRMHREEASTLPLPSPSEARNSAEPYMLHGYESLPNINGVTAPTEHTQPPKAYGVSGYNRANDPVYQGREWWQHASEPQPMEHQYGMVQHMRMYGFQPSAMEDREDQEMQ